MTEPEQTDDEIVDGPLQEDITLYGEVVVAASEHAGPLSENEIDEALGIRPTTGE